jgi:hypothetical protein
LRSDAGFVAGFAAAVAVTLSVAAAINYAVDPYGIYASELFLPYSWNLRQAKVDQLQRAPQMYEVLMLGSSRSFGISPAGVRQQCGLSAFNASVPSGRLIDHVALLHAALARADAGRLRVVFLQLDLESFWLDIDIPFELRATPALLRYAGGGAPSGPELAVDRAMRLVSLSQLMDSARSIRQQRTGLSPNLSMSSDGVVRFASREEAIARGGYDVQAAIAEEIPYEEELFRAGHAISDVQVRRFRALAQAAATHGVELVVWLSPVHPRLIDVLRPLGWDRQRQMVVSLLERLQQTERFALHDLTTIDRFGGRSSEFINATHVTSWNADRILNTLLTDTCRQPLVAAPEETRH